MSDTNREGRWRLQLISGSLFIFAGVTFAVIAFLSAVWGLGPSPLEMITMIILLSLGVGMIRAALKSRRSR